MNMRKISVFCGSVLAWGVVAVSGFTSCDDSMSFTTDRGALLSFSTDTVRFDTVISTVGSSTRQLMVYNRNADGLRIASVRLKQAYATFG